MGVESLSLKTSALLAARTWERSQYTPRTTMKLLIILAIVATAAYAAVDESEFTEKSDPETVLLEMDAHQTVKTMLKKGATEADCKDLADTSCKEVERERRTNQRLLNKLKTGSKCPGLGQRQVRITMKHYTITRKKWQTSVTTLKTTRRTTVHFSSRRYSSITHGKCGWIFSSRTYQHVKRKVNHAVRMERILRGKTVEAKKAYHLAITIAKKLKRRCHCDTQTTAFKLWTTVTNHKLLKKQRLAHAKCKMMGCVLRGINVNNARCKAALPSLRNKVLTQSTRNEKCGNRKGGGQVLRKSASLKRRLGRL